MKTFRLLAPLVISFAAAANAQTTPVTIHAVRGVGEIRPIWNYFGYDEAGTTLIRPRTSFVPEMLKSVENL
jgi:hypothetical protein